MKTLRDSSVASDLGAELSENVQRAAESRLRESSYLALCTVGCRHRKGILSLWGAVPTDYLRQLAQALVADLEGVAEVENSIRVWADPSRDQPESRSLMAAGQARD